MEIYVVQRVETNHMHHQGAIYGQYNWKEARKIYQKEKI